jgi:hypothetical protein
MATICKTMSRRSNAANCLRRFPGEKASRRAAAKVNTANANEGTFCGRRGDRAAEGLAVVVIVSATEVELPPGVTLALENLQLVSDGRPEQLSVTAAANDPNRGATTT